MKNIIELVLLCAELHNHDKRCVFVRDTVVTGCAWNMILLKSNKKTRFPFSSSTCIYATFDCDMLSKPKQENTMTDKCSAPQVPTRRDAMGWVQEESDGLFRQTTQPSLLN